MNLQSIPFLKGASASIPTEHADYIRGQQLHTFRRLLPFGLAASSANAVILIIYLGFHTPTPELWVWACMMLVMAGLGARAVYYALKYNRAARPRPLAALKRPIIESMMLGIAWGLCPVLLLPGLHAFDLAIVLWIGAGMMTGAAFMLSTLPRAAIPFILFVSVGIGIGLLRSGQGTEQLALFALLITLTVVMMRTTIWNHSNFVRSWLQQVQLTDQARRLTHKNEVISLLLNEFEKATSDCLWETDADGHLVRVSDVLAERLAVPASSLSGESLIRLLGTPDFHERPEIRALAQAVDVRGPIRMIIVPIEISGVIRWWSLSAKPAYMDGVFDGYRGVASDVTEARRAEKRIAYLAHFDPLTDLPKRERFREALDAALVRAEEAGEAFAVHCLDIDRFKTINDVHGHGAGDLVLQMAAKRLQELLGPDDLVARFGGDEFVILQRNISGPDSAMALAAAVQESLCAPAAIDGVNLQSSVSVGIALCPFNSSHGDDLLKFADLALMRAKDIGRASTCFFEPLMNDEASLRSQMELELRQAIPGDQFSLLYQPITGASGDIVAYEALLRWNQPERGQVQPADFIPILEQSGLITAAGEWIIRQALAEVKTWDNTAQVSINLSPLQVKNKALVGTVMNALAQTGVDPGRVDFEITESVLLEDTEDSLSTLHALRNLGVTISLDDFGTGYSSLSYLRCFPFDKIKIDKSFIDQMDTSGECMAIIRAVIGLAGSLGMRTTAEGIESASQARSLVTEGCSELQGFYFSRPKLPADLVRDGLLKKRAMHTDTSEPLQQPAGSGTPARRKRAN